MKSNYLADQPNAFKEIKLEDVEDMARGAAFLGSGGGGDPYLGRLTAQHAIEVYGGPKCITVDELNDDDAVYPLAMMGAPSVMTEKITGIDEIEAALAALEKHSGRPAKALMPLEIGGINAMLPIAVAAKRGLPIVDADGMGRAFPELQMTTFAVHGVPVSPACVANEHSEYQIIHARDNIRAENAARQLVIEMGASVGLACYPMLGADVKRSSVYGTISLALGIGRAIAKGRREGDPFKMLLSYLRSTEYYKSCGILFDGKISDLERKVEGGFTRGLCIISDENSNSESMKIVYQNEHLRASVGNATRCVVPDIICILDSESAEPITTEGLRYGQRVKVVGVSCASSMRAPAALEAFGPSAFGFGEPFVPVEQLMQKNS